MNLRRVDGDRVSLSLDETSTAATVLAILDAFGVTSSEAKGTVDTSDASGIPAALERSSDFLTHPVFHSHHSETAMLRYLRRLSDRDFALDRGMIPLGSCTMKLNATTEMEAITWPEFANLHPFAPAEQTEGIRDLIDQLAAWLCEITGYDAVSLQPNAGSQGEFAGLLAIHAYHQARGEGHRRICLIPASAHGTNAASAVMAGLKVVVVKTAPGGTVDMDDLRAKVETHRDDLAAIMVTYPSTHGVYEDTITELCELVHEAGGQVYVDGANLNALVGLAQPGRFGADVSPTSTSTRPSASRTAAAAPASARSPCAPTSRRTCPTTRWPPRPAPRRVSARSRQRPTAPPASCRSRGPTCASWVATACATRPRWPCSAPTTSQPGCATTSRCSTPVSDGLVAHECILDVRQITAETGVTVDDIAKRLIDYGFHAPTMSFPVAGTLMVEPTESEDRHELDRFCDAMIAISGEIEAIRRGEVAVGESMLRHAPHTALNVAGPWEHPYDRVAAAFPVGVHAADKYWPPVSRIDGAYGDRNLVCSCPPPEAFES